MGRAGTIARRTFLVGSVAVVGGVAFGAYVYKRPVKNPLEADLQPGEATFNPFVKVDAQGVTLITPRADVGQGAYSIQAHLLAEELDVDLAEVRIDPGMPSPAYYNSVVAAEGFPIAATSDSLMARTGRGAAEVAAKVLGLQLTGGSSTVPDMYDRLRHAGAVARETLLAAAARQTGLDRDQLSTDKGAVVLPDGMRLAYADLAATAAEIAPVQDVTLRDPSEWRALGKAHMRTDTVAKSTGTQLYGVDMWMEGMVHATTRTNPALGGGILGYDAGEAEKMRGVRAILPISSGFAVVADNTWRAFRAADAVKPDWGPSPYTGDSAAQFAAVAASLVADRQDSRFKDEGDVDSALESGEVLEAEYRIPYLAHAPLEPMSVVVHLADGVLDIWTGTQIPRFVQDGAAAVAGIEPDAVRVHVLMSGGSFGRRLEDDYVRQAVEIAVQMPDTPIKMVWTREEDMTHDFPRPLAIGRARGAVRDGQVAAYDLGIAAPSVAASSLGRLGQPVIGPDVAIVAGAWDQPYAIPDYRVTGYRVPPMVPVSSWRSVGASGNGFLHETFLDELCHAAGADPLEERLRLCWHATSRKVLEAVGDMSNWGSDLGTGRGRGVAFTLSFGVPVAEVVEVTQTERGLRIDKVFVAADVGRVLDPVNFEAQLSGGVIWGLGHAMNCELTYVDGAAQQNNFHAFEGMRLYQTPQITIRGLENGDRIRGIGEPGVPPAAPALGNAIFAATGQRIRELPFSKHVDFA
ncbi:isoquinoline 1-oxidoreductase [Sulfitobacter alexandrii]|uniref:Isoquinoline 1-oxidoreductase n=1 Tax=Sulfitobacter alexandrii TaxID=1917485 RepID=A0A1J0WES8_9RHOB|nr:molybdopterin cofactor-binding domain-containing protein [Sulfitobacter alexandrii]APE42811.1 isoquinoline 1-oxidoreductase [Sulfitobacter alexandrii]